MGVSWDGVNCFLQQLYRFVDISLFVRDSGQQIQPIGIIRFFLEGLTVEIFRLIHLSPLMVPESLFQQ